MEFTKFVQKWQLYSAHRAVLSCIFWLILWHLFTSSNGATKEEERVALLQLRDSLNRPNGSALVNEWVGNDYCDWDGIRCDRNLLVHNIVLPSIRQLGLGIWYPNATLLSHFENLEYLYLSDNNIGSWIMPEALRRMSNLKELDLSSNPLNGDIIPQIRCLPSLEELYLSTIYPSHAFIPALSALCGLRNLKVLNLRDNFLDESSIPSCLFNNGSSLEILDISQNKLKYSSSFFFSGICRLQKLKTLSLNGNLIQGGIDPCLSKMTSLVSLDLSFNLFQGNFPSFIFCNLTSLVALFISDNKFDGTLSFATFANLSNLRYIDLSNKDFMVNTESPSWLPSFQLMSLKLRNCRINNDQGRVVPSFISHQTRFATSSLEILDISDNRLSGQLSSNIRNSFPELDYLNTSSNAFKGEIPSSYGNLTKLVVLDLSNNFLQGKIPINLRQNHTSLAQLILSGNNFHEETMPSFSNKSNFAYLHLQNVGFGGTITGSLINLPILKVLEISQNNLSGSIPDWFHTFPNLAIILLSRNQFHGTIPISLCQMQKLNVLDLSANNLSGSIPPEIVQLYFISTFNLSFNNLSGSIPFENNFQTFGESSYRGNKGLCGIPLHTACTSPNKKPPQQDEEEERAGIAESDFFFFSCIAVSYVVGFWAVILPLVVSKNWRRKHYAVVDCCIYICCNKFSGFLTRIKDCC
ncbi:hypothetical protein ACH5RR_034743 [Cinchona calisaya]|uniref:Leucine-rich repeat-containing N-terminal plant-type domain-containing protein n=1 Tax=Cinchona calisaya TaxID=153742 RepID=A0ABD2YG97_9GENT